MKPQISLHWPIWWHQHGNKVRLQCLNKKGRIAEFSSNAASLRLEYDDKDTWLIHWRIIFSSGERVKGTILMPTYDLKAAFALSNETGEFGAWLLDRFGGDVAFQGSYIRWEKYLNIPGPGTGHDGDPNISIFLDEPIINAVRQLIEQT